MKQLSYLLLALTVCASAQAAPKRDARSFNAYYQLSNVTIEEEPSFPAPHNFITLYNVIDTTTTASGSSTATATGTTTGTGTATGSSTGTVTNTATSTGTVTNTGTGSGTGTVTSTATNTYTNTYTATNTGSGTATSTVTNTATETRTSTVTNTSTITNTVTMTQTSTSTSTNTGTRGPAIWDLVLGGDWNSILLVGNKIVDIVKANQPVVNVKRDAVSATPAGITDWQMLSGWKPPLSKNYNIVMKNKFGMEVVRVRVKVTAMWGGSAAGRGQYLANVIMVPVETYVAWGWSLDLWSENRDPVNAGTFEQPIAALGFDVRYKVKTYFNEMAGMQDYYITGDGKLTVME